MSISDKLTGYIPASFKTNNTFGPFIEYFVYNPATDKMDRFRTRLQRIKKRFPTQAMFKSHCNTIILTLNTKLAAGWTPYGEQNDVREFTPMDEAIEAFIKDKKRDLRDASMVSYVSICKILIEYMKNRGIEKSPVSNFTHNFAQKFMDYIISRPGVSNNTYNSHLKKYKSVGSWLAEHCYLKSNPFDKIKPRQKEEKTRALISSDTREKVLEFIRNSKEPNYEIVLHLIFYSLIRPTEIERLKVSDIDLENHCVHLVESQTKTHKERYASLHDDTIDLIAPMIDGVPGDWYLLGGEFKPSPKPCYHHLYKKRWEKIRRRCGLPNTIQLYSLKDSGITELLQSGLDPLTVMKAADHHDLTTTTKYASHRDEHMIAKVRDAGVRI